MTGLNFFFFFRKFGSVIYQTCEWWIRYPDTRHIDNFFWSSDIIGERTKRSTIKVRDIMYITSKEKKHLK